MNAPARKALSNGLASALLTFGLAGWLPAQNGKATDFSKLLVAGSGHRPANVLLLRGFGMNNSDFADQ